MTRRDTATGSLSIRAVTGEATIPTSEGETAVAILLDGELTVRIDEDERLRHFDAVLATDDDTVLWSRQ